MIEQGPIRTLEENIEPLFLAKEYLKFELRKIFSDVTEQNFWEKFDQSIADFEDSHGIEGFWRFLAAISDGFKLNWLFRILSSDQFSWRREIWPIKDITLTGVNPIVNQIVIEKCQRDPIKLRQYLKVNPQNLKVLEEQGLKPHPKRDNRAILLRQDGAEFKVLDGMRRTCLAAISGKEEIEAYVGYQVNPAGRAQISPDKVYFLTLLYEDSTSEEKQEIKESLQQLLAFLPRRFRNAKAVLEERQKTIPDKDSKELLRQVLK